LKTPLRTAKAFPSLIEVLSMTFETFGLNEAYKRVQKVGDHLSEFDTLIEWDVFRPLFEGLSHNKTRKGGRLEPSIPL